MIECEILIIGTELYIFKYEALTFTHYLSNMYFAILMVALKIVELKFGDHFDFRSELTIKIQSVPFCAFELKV